MSASTPGKIIHYGQILQGTPIWYRENNPFRETEVRITMSALGKGVVLCIVLVIGIIIGLCLAYAVFSSLQGGVNIVTFTNTAPKPIGPYSQAVGSSDYLFLSGQIGIDPATGNLSESTENQTVRAMENIREVLKAEDLGFSHVVQTRIFLTNLSDLDTVNRVYSRYFTDRFPSRSTVGAAWLPKGARVEIEMIALRPQEQMAFS